MKILTTIIAAVLCLTACTAKKSETSSETMEKKVLVAYYSATGTTKAQAETIANAIDATLYEITPAELYTEADLDWRDQQSRSSIEMKDENSRPALGGETIAASNYDLILIGFPIWWDLAPRVVNTWIESQELKGKTVIPFATSGGSTIANSEKDLRRLYPDLNWQEGKLLNDSASVTAEWAKGLIK